MKTILIGILAMLMMNGCVAALHDDMTPTKARQATTTELQFVYGSYRGFAHQHLPNIEAELIRRKSL